MILPRIFAPATYWKREASTYKAQAIRFARALDRANYEHAEEILKLQTDLSWAMDANARLALELSEKDYELSNLRGEC